MTAIKEVFYVLGNEAIFGRHAKSMQINDSWDNVLMRNGIIKIIIMFDSNNK